MERVEPANARHVALARESDDYFCSAFDCAPLGMALVALDGRWLRVNRALHLILGYSEPDLLAMDFRSITHADDRDADLALAGQLIAGAIPNYHIVKRCIQKAGRLLWVLLSVSVVRSRDGKPLHFVFQVQNVTGQKVAEQIEKDRLQVLEMVARDMPLTNVLSCLAKSTERQLDAPVGFMVVQEGAICLHASDLPADWLNALQQRSLPLAVALSKGLWGNAEPCGVTYFRSDEIWEPERDLAKRHGFEACWTLCVRSSENTPLGLLTIFSRRSRPPTPAETATLEMAGNLATLCIEHHNTTRALAHLVRHDPLTGLPNRIFFEDRLQQAMALADRSGNEVAVFVMDVDHFKQINDTLGHDAGDALLQQFAQRLSTELRVSDTFARMGGDEFMLILPELSARSDAMAVAEKMQKSLEEPFHVCGQDLRVTSSMGIAIFPDDGQDSPTLQRRADEQMYKVKRRGRNGYSITPVQLLAHAGQ